MHFLPFLKATQNTLARLLGTNEMILNRREAREQSAISQAIEASVKEKELYEKSRLFVSLKELDLKKIDAVPYSTLLYAAEWNVPMVYSLNDRPSKSGFH
ncbi:hypothetical protein AVEN_34426-1 [Araneus ventricosus]|uniref:Uncharacterized protein n=1 Tax=Araneus ventricosus TaxID=182803 RepID=A0A4Y2G671_ARAVE|nr:hypothetical protein AVEN_34426-1 [Araneus ventricosus]